MFNASKRGFSITFENGWTVSVQFGPGCYCSNKFAQENITESPNAEIAAWDSNGKWFDFEHDQVKGYCKPDEVLKFMNKIASMKRESIKDEDFLNQNQYSLSNNE